VYIPVNTPDKRKFLLENMESFSIDTIVSTGSIDVYIGLDPATIGPGNYLWKMSNSVGIKTISVKSTDKNFHMATNYYIKTFANTEDSIFSITLK
jgi:hypothetical protein